MNDNAYRRDEGRLTNQAIMPLTDGKTLKKIILPFQKPLDNVICS